MNIPTWLSKALLVASILAAGATSLGAIRPLYGIAATAAAGILMAFGDGFKKFILPQGYTVAGIILLAGMVFGYLAAPENAPVFAFIDAKYLALLGNVGAFLTIAGSRIQVDDVLEPVEAGEQEFK